MDFIRFEALIGKEKFDIIKNLRVVVIGLGGVGGYVLESLVRCGINNFLIIDFDKVDITNKNRQIIANDNTIGKNKCDAFVDRIKTINKNADIKIFKEFLNEDNLNIITDYNPDYIIDAIDSVKTKQALIKLSIENNYKLVTCLGTGKRLDASKLKITTLDKTSYDPIARILRKYVKDNHINKKLTVLYSSEQPIKSDCDFIPSCSFVPSTAGLLITSHVVNDIINNKK